ncbi:hypothetical protein HH308_22405 [Gordonia sp. TBRC 11910]|uniref:MurNAc-LAA domain-containing protein n=2 Tax=Gordonia asplenii TaxID=2725283 RepID=A0A848L601_9ACTN|nr:hypothetical protein [Gordonia asplenii]
MALSIAVVLSGCAAASSGGGAFSSTPSRSSSSLSQSSTTPLAAPTSKVACAMPVVALDPGHNPVRIDSFDPKTGAAQIDYPNGAEDADAFSVASQVAAMLRGSGYPVVLLKRSTAESVTYRQRVDRAEDAHAAIGVSIHTSPGVHEVFVQRVGLYREGTGADGKHLRVTFDDAATARASQRYGAAIAAARSRAEGHRVAVTDNDFSGRAPLWTGNIPIIALIATHTPWVYNEFSPGATGGSIAVDAASLRAYATGIANGIRAALPTRC